MTTAKHTLFQVGLGLGALVVASSNWPSWSAAVSLFVAGVLFGLATAAIMIDRRG